MRTMLTMQNVVYIIISNIPPTVYIRYTAFWNFSKLLFVLHILAFTKFQLRWYAPFQLLWTLFKSSFLPLHSLWKSDLKSFQTFWNCSLFWTFWLFRNYYSGDAHHVNYGKHSLKHYFWYCAHLYDIYSVFKSFEIALCFAHFGFNEISTPVMRTMQTTVNVVQIIISNIPQTVISDLQRFETFWNCCLFCTFGLLRNFYSGDAPHANYDKHTLNHDFQHSANCVYQIYSVLKLFEIAICFAYFGFYEISTPVMRTVLTMQNVVYIIISNIPPTVYIRYTAFWNFSKLLLVLHILAVTKFLHRWCASCSQWQRYFKSTFPTLLKLCIWDFQRFQIVRNSSSFPHFEFCEIFTAVMCTMLIIVNFV